VSTTLASAHLEYAPAQTLRLMPAAVGFYFALRYSLSYLFFQSDPRTGGAVGVSLNFLCLVAVIFYSFGPTRRSLRSSVYAPCFRWVIAFLGWSLFSLFWSITVSVPVAIGYWCGITADVAIVLFLLRAGPLEPVAVDLMKGYVYGACCIAIITWCSPTMQDLRPGNDDFFSPNAVALILAFGVFLAQYVNIARGSTQLTTIFLSITLLRTLSKSTIFAFAAGQAIILMRDRAISRRKALAILAATGAVIVGFWPLIVAYFDVYTNAGNQAETLTGRVGVWGFVLERAVERPWFGHGFHSFRNVIPPFGVFEPWHAHNEVLQLFYAYGVIGILLFLGIHGSFYRLLRRLPWSRSRALFLGLLIFILVRGLADTDRFEITFPLWFITLVSSLLMPIKDGFA
jgi:exopolysaccharide production protein ExoQ